MYRIHTRLSNYYCARRRGYERRLKNETALNAGICSVSKRFCENTFIIFVDENVAYTDYTGALKLIYFYYTVYRLRVQAVQGIMSTIIRHHAYTYRAILFARIMNYNNI